MQPPRSLRFISLLLLLLLVGCVPGPALPGASGQREPTARSAARRTAAQQQPSSPVTITWSFWGDPWELAVNQRVARAFESENPTIKVELLHKPWSEYFDWLEGQWRQGTSPDVMFLNYIPARAPAGQLEPLDPYIQRDRFDLSDFYPRLLELFAWNGTYYGLPRDNDTKVIYYNKALFAAAGLDPPRSGWTWTDLRNLASRLTKRDELGRTYQYGFAFEANTWWLLFVWQNGSDLTNDPFNPTHVRLGESSAVDAIQWLADLVNADRSTPTPDVLLDTEKISTLFRQGKLAMALGNHAQVPIFAETAGLDWDIVGLPAGRQRANLAGGAGYTMSSTSRNKDAAWALLRYLESPKGQALFAESGVIVPARRSIREDNVFLRQQPYNARVWAEETEYGRPNLNAPVREPVVRLVEGALASVWLGGRSAADAIGSILPELRRLVEG